MEEGTKIDYSKIDMFYVNRGIFVKKDISISILLPFLAIFSWTILGAMFAILFMILIYFMNKRLLGIKNIKMLTNYIMAPKLYRIYKDEPKELKEFKYM